MVIPSKNNDLAFGLQSEINNKALLERFFSCTLQKTGTFDPMDMTDENRTIYIELKTRRVKHNQYPTALIGKNKVDFCAKTSAVCYFVYVYMDGLYYIKYDKELFDTFECADYERGWRDGGIQPKQLFYYIPHIHLIRIDTPDIS